MIIALSALAVLTRYDSILFVAPVSALGLWRARHEYQGTRVPRAAALTILLWVAFTQMYYGDILPTSYYVKSPLTPSEGELGRGLIYLVSFAVLSLAFVGFLFHGARDTANACRSHLTPRLSPSASLRKRCTASSPAPST
jgi:hypothetical protein